MHQNRTIGSLIEEMGLKPFATINSARKSYLVDNICVDLDETDFGYKIGQMEVILENKEVGESEMENAIQMVTNLTSKLGLNFS